MSGVIATYELTIGGKSRSQFLLAASIERGFAGPLARVASVGRATVRLRYAPGLYDVPSVGEDLVLSVTYSVSAVLFSGRVVRATPVAGRFGPQEVVVEAEDALGRLDVVEADIPLQTNVQGHSIVSALTQAALGLSTTGTGVTVFPVSGEVWTEGALRGVNAASKIGDVVASDWARFFVARDGTPTYRNRHADILARIPPAPVLFTIDNAGVAYDVTLGEDTVVNRCEVRWRARTVGTVPEVLARASTTVSVAPGASETLMLEFVDASAANAAIGGFGLIAPVSGVDYRATDDVAGEGNTVTVNPTFAGQYADRCELVLTNPGSAVAYVRNLQVRGTPVRARDEQVQVASDGASIAAHGRRTLGLEAPLLSSDAVAQRMADMVVADWQEPRRQVRGVTLEANASAGAMAFARDVELGSRVRVVESQTGVDLTGVVYGIRHSIEGRARHTVSVDVQAEPTGVPFRVGVSQINGSDILIF